jgi:hypothetical protein
MKWILGSQRIKTPPIYHNNIPMPFEMQCLLLMFQFWIFRQLVPMQCPVTRIHHVLLTVLSQKLNTNCILLKSPITIHYIAPTYHHMGIKNIKMTSHRAKDNGYTWLPCTFHSHWNTWQPCAADMSGVDADTCVMLRVGEVMRYSVQANLTSQPHNTYCLCYSKLVLNMFRSSKEVAPPWSNICSMSESSCCCWGGPPDPCCPDGAPPAVTVPPEPPACPAEPPDPWPESDGWPEPCQAHIPATHHYSSFFHTGCP